MDELTESFRQAFEDLADVETLFTTFAAILALMAVLALGLRLWRAHGQVQRRISEGSEGGEAQTSGGAMKSRVGGLVSSLAGNLDEVDSEGGKVLRKKLIQAGYYDRNAVAMFFGIRVLGLVGCGLLLFGAASFLVPDMSVAAWSVGGLIGVLLGYLAPAVALDKRIQALRIEHLSGFPDFMDLMVVCSQAGLSMEAGLARIAEEISVASPSLSRNLLLATREIRGGKPLSKAIESLAHRLGIEEAISFATLLQQSEELGSSITQSLRAYSDDMRNKRLMKAEEKAYALPAKMVIPLTLFIFPVLLVVLMLPVVISVSGMNS